MVTHDVNLKQLAQRVIKVSDGKIAAIEEVPAEVQESARARLFAEGQSEERLAKEEDFEPGRYKVLKWIKSRTGQ
jgi:ABC-type lipoprotein export system ATPase subunit